MFAGRLRMLAPLVAGAMFVASVAVASGVMAPVAVAAAGLANAPAAGAVIASNQPRPELRVSANGVEVDARGNTVYAFTVANTGTGLAQNVKVTQLLQVKETVSPQRVKKTITVTEMEQLAAGQAQTVTIICEKSARYTCEYGSVTAATDDGETWAGDNYAAQGA